MTNDDVAEDEDAAAYRAYGRNLVDAVDASIRPWLMLVVTERFGGAIPPESAEAVEAAVSAAADEAHRSLTELALASPETPLSGPLERLRRSVQPVTDMLDAASVPKPPRNPVDMEMRPNDTYAIGPLTFTDLSQDVHTAGITWGAAKAYIHTRRREPIARDDDQTA